MKRRSDVTFLPRRTSMTSSVGTRTSSISSSRPASATAVLICSAIFFSKFERTLTEYHRFAMPQSPLSPGPAPGNSFIFLRFARSTTNKKQRATRIDARRFPLDWPQLQAGGHKFKKKRDRPLSEHGQDLGQPGADDQIDDKEEQRCQRRHDEDHDRGQQDLAPGRPDDLAHFGPDLLKEL